MNKLYLCVMLILLSTVAIAGVYVPGYVIFKTTNPITVIQTEPQLQNRVPYTIIRTGTLQAFRLLPLGE